MLLLRWLFPQDISWSFYDLEDDPQEQFDEDWLGFYFEDDIVRTEYPDEDIREEDDDQWIYRLEDDSTELVEEFIEVILVEEDIRDESEEDWWDAYGQTDTPPPPDTTSEQIWYIFSQEEEEDRGDYEDDLYDAYGQVDQPTIILLGGKQLIAECLRFPDSTNIETVMYDKSTGEMQIRFKEGSTYKYDNVTPNKFKGIGRAKSAGTYFANKIKPKYPGKKI